MSLFLVGPYATHISRLSQALTTSAKEKGEVLFPSRDSVCKADTSYLHRSKQCKNSETLGKYLAKI